MIHVYVGTFTRDGRSEGIYVYDFEPATGAFGHRQTVPLANPSYLAISASRRMLYAACHVRQFEGQPGAAVVAFAIAPESGLLTRLEHVSIPPNPAYIRLDRTEQLALFACTHGGALGALPITPEGGVGEPTAVIRHEGTSLVDQGHPGAGNGQRAPYPSGSPFPHSIQADPANRFVLVPDLGLNRVYVYRLDPQRGTLTPNETPWAEGAPLGDHRMTPDHAHWESPRGAGPRHLDFHPTAPIVYVVNELGSTISVFEYDAEHGIMTNVQDIGMLPESFRAFNIAADIHVHPNGRFLYASNRGHESIATYAIDESTKRLSLLGFEPTGGKHPRNFALTPDARLLLVANMNTDNVVAFEIDDTTGRPRANGTVNLVPSPSCITFLID